MSDTSWIIGLARENTDAIGFIPAPTLEWQYIRQGRYIIQGDEQGRRVGFLLHGAIRTGQSLVISQHCIQYEKRNRDYGRKAFMVLLDRARRYGASSIRLRCGCDLEAIRFWQAVGFQIIRIIPGGERRQRVIAEMVMPLHLPLFADALDISR